MKLQLLFIFLLNIHLVQATGVLVDPLNDTKIDYALRSTDVKGSPFGSNRMRILYPFLRGGDWEMEEKLNLAFKSLTEELVASEEVYQRFLANFSKNLRYILKLKNKYYQEDGSNSYLENIEEYKPINFDIESDILAINDHVLIMRFHIDYEIAQDSRNAAFENCLYEELYYFDLNDAEQIDPNILFDKRNELNKIAFSRIPKTLMIEINKSDIENAKPVFHGAACYLIIKGLSEASNPTDFNYHLRFDLKDIQPFINKKSPWKGYFSQKAEAFNCGIL